MVRLVVMFVAACFALPTFAGEKLHGKATAVDGDGLRLHGISVRIAGIDAPERDQLCLGHEGYFRCGEAMRLALARDLARRDVVCLDRGARSYDRVVAQCFIGGEDLGAYLISQGRARAHPKYATAAYLALERRASSAGHGLWAFQMTAPWEHRAAQRAQAAAAVAETCMIKGNISKSGEQIYHAPGQRDYARVKISERKGERCFASEREARAAGWRRALR
ncbi:thermonuclease family protein [Primorskyibacter sp. S187A]|uniref:thermonuclease family protein n=1 Tax=Primorskyibacter sp. S187A TaxID=3415130 RepID=UPI003C7A5FA1